MHFFLLEWGCSLNRKCFNNPVFVLSYGKICFIPRRRYIYIYIYICPRVHLILFIFIKEVFSIYGLRNFGFKNQGKSFYFETPKIFISSQYLMEQYLKLQKKSLVNLTWDFFIKLVGDKRLDPVGFFFCRRLQPPKKNNPTGSRRLSPTSQYYFAH